MLSFKTRFFKVVQEDNLAGSGGVFGDFGGHGGDVGNSDWYAPDDARNFFGWGGGVIHRRRKKRKKSRKRKSKR